MADFKKLSWMQSRLKTTPRMTYEDIDPGSGWTNDPDSHSHQLLLNLPEFKRSDIKLQIDNSGTIVVSGETRVAENKRVRFRKTFKAPEDSDLNSITTKFEGDTFDVNIPKLAKKRKEEPEIKNIASSSQLGEEKREEFQSPKDVEEKQEQKIQNVVSSSDSREEKREESGRTKEVEESKEGKKEEKAEEKENSEVKEMKDEPEKKNGALDSDLREDRREEIDSSKEADEMKEEQEIKNGSLKNNIRQEKREEFESSEEDRKTEEEPHNMNGDLRNGIHKQSVRFEDAKEADEREEYESSEVTKENKGDPELKNGAVSNDIREDKKEESESAKITNEKKEQPGIQNTASSSELAREESGNPKDGKVEKADEVRKEQKSCQLVKGKDSSSHGGDSEKSVMERIIEQRGILLASIISFTLGVLVSQKFHKPPSR